MSRLKETFRVRRITPLGSGFVLEIACDEHSKEFNRHEVRNMAELSLCLHHYFHVGPRHFDGKAKRCLLCARIREYRKRQAKFWDTRWRK